jgi:hypothetical protein
MKWGFRSDIFVWKGFVNRPDQNGCCNLLFYTNTHVGNGNRKEMSAGLSNHEQKSRNEHHLCLRSRFPILFFNLSAHRKPQMPISYHL